MPRLEHLGPQIGADYFNAYAEALVTNGFTVTPTRGKVPFLPRWHNPKPTDPQWLAKMLRRNRFGGCNIGIVCGRVVGVDIDADDHAKAGLLEGLAAEHLGPTTWQRIGRAPRTLLLYRAADDEIIGSVKIGGIDVLSGGKQFVAYGVHPVTDKPYQWIDRRHTPATASIHELPIITETSVRSFIEAACTALGSQRTGVPTPSRRIVDAASETGQRTRQGEMLGSVYDPHIERNAQGLVIDGRESFLAKISAAEFAKRAHASPIDLAHRIWAQFIAEADLSRPKGGNQRRRWELRDAISKARSICRRNPDLNPPRRSRRGHPTSFLHGWRRPGFWKLRQRKLHLAEVKHRIVTPSTLVVARVMIDALDLASGFCTLPIGEIAKRACCSTKTVKAARKALNEAGLWIAGRGVFVPCPAGELNRRQLIGKTEQKRVPGTTAVPSLYHLVQSTHPLKPSSSPSEITARPYQPDMFGAPVVDLANYRRGQLPFDLATAVRAELRALGATQDELAALLGISQPQLANALAGRFGLSPDPAARLLAWLQRVA
jgi:hypothetical protein